jgi:chaperonin GroES
MKVKPLSNNILLEVLQREQMTKSGIVLPDTVEEKRLMEGKVVAVGPGKMNDDGERIPMSVSVGDTVLVKKPYSPDEIEEGDKKFLIVEESDVIGIVEA